MFTRIVRTVMWILVSIDAIGTLWLASLSLFGGYVLDQGTWEYVGGGNSGAAAVILFGVVVAAVIVFAARSLLRRG